MSNVTGWSRGLEVSGGGQGVVSHAGLALLRHLADKTGLAGGLSRALATPRILVHDRGRVLADLACAVADGARVISDFRVMADQRELFGLVASVPTAWRTLKEIAGGGTRADKRITAAVNTARRHAWTQVVARHGTLPGVRLADKILEASHELVRHLDKLAARPGYQVIYSVGWALTEREKTALRLVPEQAWQIAIDGRGEVRERRADDPCGNLDCGHRRCWVEEAHVTELSSLLREGPGGDRLKAWPATMRIFARRERPHPGAQLTLFEAEDGWRYTLWVTNRPAATKGWLGQNAYIDAAHRVHARVEDAIRTGKDAGLGHFPSVDFAVNQAWLTAAMTAQILLAWLKLLALDGDLAKAEPKTLRYRILHAAARLVHGGRRRRLKIQATWPWAAAITAAWQRIDALPQAP